MNMKNMHDHMMHAANTVTVFHLVGVLTVNPSTYVQLPTFFMPRAFNFVISFYFLVS